MKSDEILPSVVLLPESSPGFEQIDNPAVSILILLPESNQWDEEKTYLSKMFEAAHKEVDKDIIIQQLAPESIVSFQEMIRQTSITDVYLFGIEASQIGLQSSLPFGYSVHIGNIFLYRTDSPLKVSKNAEMKKRIWDLFQKRYLHDQPA